MKRRLTLQISFKAKLRIFTFGILLPLAVLAFLLLNMMSQYNAQYNMIVRNVTVASEFNVEFKKTLDSKMYRYIVGGYKNFEEYSPLDDINDARGVVERLKQSTTRPDSLARLRYITHFMDNLEKYIGRTRASESYEISIANLENNIYGLTELISDEIHNYIYYETRELADLQQRTNGEIQRTIYAASLTTAALIVVLWIVALVISNSMTKPIKQMVKNIEIVGGGDFTVRHVASSNDEFKTLSDSFDIMVEQIGELVDEVQKKQETLRRMELQLLQAQINPHFLYNTFDTIIWLAEDKQTKQVVDVTTSLSNYFRTTLSKGRDFITLKEEKLHVQSYLEIQHVRYQDILTYEIDIPEELCFLTLPKLTLQPLVENALYHGIKYKRGLGKIKVGAALQGDTAVLTVFDDGPGLSPAELERLNQSIQSSGERHGFGCANVHERIRLYYGEPYGLTITSEEGEGTYATVLLPVKNTSIIQ